MARELREGREIVFADGEKRTVYPLTIRQLRKFLKAAGDLKTEGDNLEDEDIDKMIAAAKIALEKEFPLITEDELEDILDMRSFNELIAAAMGADPNE